MESLTSDQPSFFSNFNIEGHQPDSAKWGGLYQPDGGSIDMEETYGYFYNYAKNKNGANRPVDFRG
jgi:hypothetical protein